MNDRDRERLAEEIARSRARVADLERERDVELMRITELEAAIAALDEIPPTQPSEVVADPEAPTQPAGPAATRRTPEQKLQIFRELFRGREDVYPTRFESAKTGKQGYGPACANKFERGVCELPKVKCGECKNQKFLPADDAAYWKHLAGGHVMGVYPMLSDSTCWFLAVDFDKATWTEDVRAFIATCRKLDLPFVVERSRSGKGAHVWFFFSAPVSAWSARKLGSYVLTQTMAARHELSMDSYDRLFPSQDQMPKGGFGNLIALPLQKEARKLGNTELLDDDLVPFPGEQQWDVLASVRRIDPATVERVVADAARDGEVLGVRTSTSDEDAAPWLISARKREPARIPGPLPARASAVLAQRLFIATGGLPSPLINLIKRTAAFENPEFHKKQAMRMSTARTPRVVSCAEDFAQHVAVPRGCLPDVIEILRAHSIALDLDDQRTDGIEIDVTFGGALTPLQQQAAAAILANEIGVLVAPPGVGKTVIGTYLIAARRRSTLILVHRGPLLDQWRSQLAMFLGIEPKQIGQIGAGKERITGQIDIAMIPTLARRDDLELLAGYGHVIVDECHHVSAVSHERVVAASKARYITGLTATPKRRDGHHPILEMQLGPVRYAIDAKSQAARRPFEHKLIARETAFRAANPDAKIQELYALLTQDEARNRMIINDVIAALEEGRSPILLTERTDHLDYFAAELSRVARHVVVLRGGMGAKATREVFSRMAAIPADAERVVLATGRYIGEGFDDPRLDTLFLTLPVSWQGTLIQYAGRLHRLHPGKRDVRIFDYVDLAVPMLAAMFKKRLRGYRSIGYARGEAPLGYAEPKELTIEYDADAGLDVDA
jgi:superfamily II DNA or RNA helicase